MGLRWRPTAAALALVLIAACVGDDPEPGGVAAVGPEGGSDGAPPSSDAGDNVPDVIAPEDAASDGNDGAPSVPAPCNGAIDCERVVFVSSVTYTGDLAAPSGALDLARAKCNGLASASPIARVQGRTFEPWLSADPTYKASTTLQHGTRPYVLPNGVRIAANFAALVSGTLENPISVDEKGGPQTGPVWTGTAATGEPLGASCATWKSANSLYTSVRGLATATDKNWSENEASIGCQNPSRIYCIEF
jgi:hypothetical protein